MACFPSDVITLKSVCLVFFLSPKENVLHDATERDAMGTAVTKTLQCMAKSQLPVKLGSHVTSYINGMTLVVFS